MTDIIGVRRSPSEMNPVKWDMCYLSEHVVTSDGSVHQVKTRGCVLDLAPVPAPSTNFEWRLTAQKHESDGIKCEAFCMKLVFE